MGGDSDHWIEGNQSEPDDEGTAADDLGGWEEGVKCWWTATYGTVTQNSFTTTWTAPYKQGVDDHVEIGVIDLPKEIAQGDAGNRDDPGREYFGTPQDRRATAYWITWEGRVSGSTSHDFDFNQTTAAPLGVGQQLGVIDPDTPNSNGFHKKVEIVGQLSPARAGVQTVLHQWYEGFSELDGVRTTTDLTEDNTAMHEVSDTNGRVYVWDAPGVKFTPEWGKAAESTAFEWNYQFTDKAFWPDGRKLSDSVNWHRIIELSGRQLFLTWDRPPDQNR